MKTRLAKIDDIPAIINLGERLIQRGTFKHTHVSFRACMDRLLLAIRNPHEWLGVTEHNGAIVGFLILVAVKYWWSESERYVLDDGIYSERPGAGVALVRAGVAWARDMYGVKEVIVALNSGLDDSRDLCAFERCGFVQRGTCLSIDVSIAEGAQWAA